MLAAVYFDCDGVLVDTERDGHRVAFNRAFAAKGLEREWSVERYGELLKTAGGKERMKRDFDETAWPDGVADKDAFIRELHKLKTDLFMEIIDSGQLPLRAGVARLFDEITAAGLTVAICSTSNVRAVTLVAERMLGPERKAALHGIYAGDMVPAKKPDPAVYNLAAAETGIDPARTLVVEDSRNGLLAAVAACMPCLVTISSYTGDEDFTGAKRVVPELGDDPVNITVDDLKALVG